MHLPTTKWVGKAGCTGVAAACLGMKMYFEEDTLLTPNWNTKEDCDDECPYLYEVTIGRSQKLRSIVKAFKRVLPRFD